jgi:hypothetical protein
VSNSHTSGRVQGLTTVGGLVGNASNATVSNSYSLSEVVGVNNDSDNGAKAGGLIGMMNSTTVTGSFANTHIHGQNDIAGGLVGYAKNSTINNSYAKGSVSSDNFSGGIVGFLTIESQITNSYASTDLEGPYVGGVTAYSNLNSTIQNVRWDTSKETTGIEVSDRSSTSRTSNLMGLSAEQMKQSSNFSGFDFDNAWTLYEGNSSPLLRSFLTPLTVAIKASDSQTYNADIAYRGVASMVDQANVLAKLQGTPNYVLTSKNAGTQAVIDNGLYSDQLGYLIKYDTSESQVQIDKAPISVNGITADSKVYDGNQAASMNLSNMQASGIFAADQGTVALNISGSFDTKDVGDNKQVAISGTTGGANGGNYFMEDQSTTTAHVTPKELVVSGLKAQDKVYDGNQTAQVDTSAPFAADSGLVKNDDVQVISVTGTFSDHHAAPDKTVVLSNTVYAGADKNNYQITDQQISMASIIPRASPPKDVPDVDNGNNILVVTTPITPDPEDSTFGQILTVDNKNNNSNQESKTDRPVVVPDIKDIQSNQLAKINSSSLDDARAVNAATRLSSLEADYWFLDCFFNSSQELKKIKCEPASQKKSPLLAIKKYPNKKLSASNSPLLP